LKAVSKTPFWFKSSDFSDPALSKTKCPAFSTSEATTFHLCSMQKIILRKRTIEVVNGAGFSVPRAPGDPLPPFYIFKTLQIFLTCLESTPDHRYAISRSHDVRIDNQPVQPLARSTALRQRLSRSALAFRSSHLHCGLNVTTIELKA
jgi:hypothetical protein